MYYPTVDFVKKIHSYIIDSEGGTQGILSESLLESALDRPLTKIISNDEDYEPYKGIVRKAVALSHAIITWHPFIDGNKRTAVYILTDFLYVNWINISIPVYMAKYTIAVALEETSKGHMTEEEFYTKILPLCSKNIFVKALKDFRFKTWTKIRFNFAMKFGSFIIKTITSLESEKNDPVIKRYLDYIHGRFQRSEDILKIVFDLPIDWYGAGDLIIFLTRIGELSEREKQGFPKRDVPFPPESESDYIEIED